MTAALAATSAAAAAEALYLVRVEWQCDASKFYIFTSALRIIINPTSDGRLFVFLLPELLEIE